MNFQMVQNIRHGWLWGHIEELSVKEECRGQGIGTALIKAIRQYCLENGIHIIKLMCGAQLEKSHAVYEKKGFKHLDFGYRLEIT